MTMTSVDYELAAAIAQAVGTAISKTVEVVADPRVDRESLSAARYVAMPASYEESPLNRGQDTETRQVHVGVVAPADAANVETVDDCLALVDALRALWRRGGALRGKQLAGHDWVPPVKHSPLYDQQRLLQEKLFVGLLTVTYRRAV